MEGLVAQVVALSNPNDLNQLLATLKESDGLFNHNYNHIAPALEALDPAHHSLGFAYFLYHLSKGNLHPPDAGFIDHASRFFLTCNASQIRLAPPMFCFVAKKLKDHAMQARCPRRAIQPLFAGLRALQPDPEVLTPLHADFFQCCLLSRCYAAAAPVLATDIFDVAPPLTNCTPTDLFLYCYYGAMLCIGRKQLARALELLLQALTAPALAGNAIVAAAYKKYVLVCILHAGQMLPLPKFTSQCVRHVAENEGRAYNEIANVYVSRNADKLRRLELQHAALFASDNNQGLVRQVCASLEVRAIQRLTQTFLTLSLTDIAANAGLAGPAEAEARILRMAAAGQIHAKIDGRTGMVRFADETRAAASGGAYSSGVGGGVGGWDTAAGVAALEERLAQVLELGRRMTAAHEMVSTDRAYLTKVTARERSKYDLSGAGAGMGTLATTGSGGGLAAEAEFGPFGGGM